MSTVLTLTVCLVGCGAKSCDPLASDSLSGWY